MIAVLIQNEWAPNAPVSPTLRRFVGLPESANVRATLARHRRHGRQYDCPDCVFLNYDYTPMQFVTSVLEEFLHQSPEEALQTMIATHRLGRYALAT